MAPRVPFSQVGPGVGGVRTPGTAVGPTPTGALDVAREQERLGQAIGQTGRQLGTAGLQIGKTLQQEKSKVRLGESSVALRTRTNKYLTDPNFRTSDGKEAIFEREGSGSEGSTVEAAAELRAIAENVATEFGLTPAEKLVFMQDFNRFYTPMMAKIGTREGGQLKSATVGTSEANIALAHDQITTNFDDPALRDDAFSIIETQIKVIGDTLGFTQAQEDDALRKQVAEANINVVERYIAAERPNEARGYLEANKDDIGGRQVDRLEKSIEAHSVLQISQEVADEMLLALPPGEVNADGRTNESIAIATIQNSGKQFSPREREAIVGQIRARYREAKRLFLDGQQALNAQASTQMLTVESRPQAMNLIEAESDPLRRKMLTNMMEAQFPTITTGVPTGRDLDVAQAMRAAFDDQVLLSVKMTDINDKVIDEPFVIKTAADMRLYAGTQGITNKTTIDALIKYATKDGLRGQVRQSTVFALAKSVDLESEATEVGFYEKVLSAIPPGQTTVTDEEVIRAILAVNTRGEVLEENPGLFTLDFGTNIAQGDLPVGEDFVPFLTPALISELEQEILRTGARVNGELVDGATVLKEAKDLAAVPFGPRGRKIPALHAVLLSKWYERGGINPEARKRAFLDQQNRPAREKRLRDKEKARQDRARDATVGRQERLAREPTPIDIQGREESRLRNLFAEPNSLLRATGFQTPLEGEIPLPRGEAFSEEQLDAFLVGIEEAFASRTEELAGEEVADNGDAE